MKSIYGNYLKIRVMIPALNSNILKRKTFEKITLTKHLLVLTSLNLLTNYSVARLAPKTHKNLLRIKIIHLSCPNLKSIGTFRVYINTNNIKFYNVYSNFTNIVRFLWYHNLLQACLERSKCNPRKISALTNGAHPSCQTIAQGRLFNVVVAADFVILLYYCYEGHKMGFRSILGFLFCYYYIFFNVD